MRRATHHALGLLVALATALPVAAETLQSTPITQNTPSATTPAPTEQTRAEAWGLSAEEYARYGALMSGVRGSFSSPTISPLEVLGIHAQTPQEQREYAERVVRMMFEDTERVLAFQREVDAAWKRLYGHIPIIDPSRLPPESMPTTALKNRRLAVFVSTSCPECLAIMPRLLGLVDDDGPAEGLDIYVVDGVDEEAIRAWAQAAQIDPAQVQTRHITLNQGAGLFAQLGGPQSVPQVYMRDGDQLVAAPGFVPARDIP